MLSPALLLAAAISLMPIKTFDAWDIGCDNGGRCQALAIPNDDDSIGFANASDGGAGVEGLGVLVTRDAGPDGAISIAIERDTGKTAPIDIAIDDKQILTAHYAPASANFTVDRADAMRLIRAMVAGSEIEISAADQKGLYTASLKGLAAAMRYIDAQQGRTGTVSAIVATGSGPVSSVRSGTPLPRIPAVSGRKAIVSSGIIRTIKRLGRGYCDPPEVFRQEMPESYRLDDNADLVFYVCDAGEGDIYTIPFIVRGTTAAPALFDLSPEKTESLEKRPIVTNAQFDPRTGILSSFMRNNCGTGFTKDYVWDGRRFRLINASQSDTCSGGFTWITLWRADPIRK